MTDDIQHRINVGNCVSEIIDLLSHYGEETFFEAVKCAFETSGKTGVYLVRLPKGLEQTLERYRENFQGDHYEVREHMQYIQEHMLKKLS